MADGARVIAVATGKGGAGKTTTAVNLACGLARELGRDGRVLLVDIDSQAAATAILLGGDFAQQPEGGPRIRELLVGEVSITEVVRRAKLQRGASGKGPAVSLDVVPSHMRLYGMEAALAAAFQRERKLAEALEPVLNVYRFVVIDCPPSLALLTVNALMAAEEVVVPCDPGKLPMEAVSQLRQQIEIVRKANPRLHISAVLPTFVGRTVLSRWTINALEAMFGRLVLAGIPNRVSVNEAMSMGQDIFAYAPNSDGARAYAQLVKAVVEGGAGSS